MNKNKDIDSLFKESFEENTKKHQEELFKDQKTKEILTQIEKELKAYVELLRDQAKDSNQKQTDEGASKQPENIEHLEKDGVFYEICWDNADNVDTHELQL